MMAQGGAMTLDEYFRDELAAAWAMHDQDDLARFVQMPIVMGDLPAGPDMDAEYGAGCRDVIVFHPDGSGRPAVANRYLDGAGRHVPGYRHVMGDWPHDSPIVVDAGFVGDCMGGTAGAALRDVLFGSVPMVGGYE
jgi:hypothetical protein